MANLKEIFLPVKTTTDFIFHTLSKMGVPKEDAKICAKILIESDLRGIDSHGVGRLKMYVDRIKQGIQTPTTKIDVIKESPTTAVLDGNHGMGHVVAYRAMEMAIKKAKQYGMGAVSVRNSTHYGIAGYYPAMAIKENMVGLAFSNARPSISPTFGVTPLLGTNPISFGAPTNLKVPFLLDGATSISQRGKIELLARKEMATPEGWAIDENGAPVTDTNKLLVDLVKETASLLPLGGAGELLGGHKGYGLATMVEILCAAFCGGSFINGLTGFDKNNKPCPYKLGHFFIAINVENFVPIAEFKNITTEIVKTLINSKKAKGANRIYYAGEKEWESMEVRKKEGIPINENLQKTMKQLASELKITEVTLPF